MKGWQINRGWGSDQRCPVERNCCFKCIGVVLGDTLYRGIFFISFVTKLRSRWLGKPVILNLCTSETTDCYILFIFGGTIWESSWTKESSFFEVSLRWPCYFLAIWSRSWKLSQSRKLYIEANSLDLVQTYMLALDSFHSL